MREDILEFLADFDSVSIRRSLNLTQAEVASLLDVSRATYINIEAGRKDITLKQAMAMLSLIKGRFPIDQVSSYGVNEGKLKQVILNLLYFSADQNGNTLMERLLGLMLYADMIFYKENGRTITDVKYRRVAYGLVPDIFFRVVEELESSGVIIRTLRGRSPTFSLIETVLPSSDLLDSEISIIQDACLHWSHSSANELSSFVRSLKAWHIHDEGDIIAMDELL